MAIFYDKPQYRFVITVPDRTQYGGYGFAIMGDFITELSPQSASLQWVINKPSTLSVTVLKREVELISTSNLPAAWGGQIIPGAATMWVFRNSSVIWGGFIWDIQSASNSELVTFNCEDFIGYYSHITLTNSFSLAQNSIKAIMTNLLIIEGNTSCRMWMMTTQGDLATGGVDWVISPQWYEYENRKISDLISYLQGLKDGFEFTQFCTGYDNPPGTVGSAHTVAAYFAIGVPELGKDYVADTTATYRPLEWGEGTLQTIDEVVSWTYSARETATVVKVQGFGDRSQALRVTVGSGQEAVGLPRLARVINDPELGRDGGFADVYSKAKQAASVVGYPLLQAQIRLRPSQRWPMPSLLLMPPVGDRYRVRIKDMGFDFTAKLRANTWGLQLDESGTEWITMDLGPAFDFGELS